MFEKEEFSTWFKENTPKEGLSENTTFTRQFLIDAWDNGYSNGFNKANEWFYAAATVPLPKQLGIYRYTIEVISDKGDMVCYDYKDKNWKKLVIEDEKVTYVPVKVNMWCNKPTKESE